MTLFNKVKQRLDDCCLLLNVIHGQPHKNTAITENKGPHVLFKTVCKWQNVCGGHLIPLYCWTKSCLHSAEVVDDFAILQH